MAAALRLRPLLYGLATTLVPGVARLRRKGLGGGDSARYCYSVWLRHLVMAKRQGLNTRPQVVAELGPGDSLGVGLATLLSGSDRYFGFDLLEHANAERNRRIFDELIELFVRLASIPGQDEFPAVKPLLTSYEFPSDVLTDGRLREVLEPSRVARIRQALSRNTGARHG